MADSDSDDFESADEGEVEQKNKEVKAEEVKIEEVKVQKQEEVKIDEVKVQKHEEVKIEEVKVQKGKNEEVKVDEVKIEEDKDEGVKIEEVKPEKISEIEVTVPSRENLSLNLAPKITLNETKLEEISASVSAKIKETNKKESKIIEVPVKDEPPKQQRKVLRIEKKISNLKQTPNNETMTEKEAAVLDRLSFGAKEEKKVSPSSWGLGWSSSFISSAASSVSTFTSHVSQGFETVLETVEATLGAPPPEELAAYSRKSSEEKKKESPAKQQDETPDSLKGEENSLQGGLLGGLTGLTRVIESTGSKVITGGLDTLELIGKKTMDILTEGDPNLRHKRSLFGTNQVTLSQVLKDARNKIEERNNSESVEDQYPVFYGKLFDEFQGLVHLEALELISEQSKNKLEELVHILDSEQSRKLEHVMRELQDLCQDLPPTDDTPDEEMSQDFDKLVSEHISGLSFHVSIDRIKSLRLEAKSWIVACKEDQDKGTALDAKEIYTKAIRVLVETTARSMELFHKMAEIALVSGCEMSQLYTYANHLIGLTCVLCTEVSILTSQFCQCLNTAADDSEDPDSINPLITSVFLESSNSNTYIQDAFQLLVPILQIMASHEFHQTS